MFDTLSPKQQQQVLAQAQRRYPDRQVTPQMLSRNAALAGQIARSIGIGISGNENDAVRDGFDYIDKQAGIGGAANEAPSKKAATRTKKAVVKPRATGKDVQKAKAPVRKFDNVPNPPSRPNKPTQQETPVNAGYEALVPPDETGMSAGPVPVPQQSWREVVGKIVTDQLGLTELRRQQQEQDALARMKRNQADPRFRQMERSKVNDANEAANALPDSGMVNDLY